MEVKFLEQSHSTGNSNLECLQSPPTAVELPAEVESNCLKLSFLHYLRYSIFLLKYFLIFL